MYLHSESREHGTDDVIEMYVNAAKYSAKSDLLCQLMMCSIHRVIYTYGLVLTVYMLDCDKNVKRHTVLF